MVDRPRDDRTLDNYEARRVRDRDGGVLFTQRDELPTLTDDDQARYARSARSVVVNQESFDGLTFAATPEAEQIRSFAAQTDFETSSLYLFSMPVDACYEVQLQSVSVEWDELENDDLHPHADFCRTYRSADTECSVGVVHTVGYAIRLPVAAEQSSGSGSGMGGSCRRPHRGEYFNGTVTPASGGGSE